MTLTKSSWNFFLRWVKASENNQQGFVSNTLETFQTFEIFLKPWNIFKILKSLNIPETFQIFEIFLKPYFYFQNSEIFVNSQQLETFQTIEIFLKP